MMSTMIMTMMIMTIMMMTGRWWSLDSIAVLLFTNNETTMLFCWHRQDVDNFDEDNDDGQVDADNNK